MKRLLEWLRAVFGESVQRDPADAERPEARLRVKLAVEELGERLLPDAMTAAFLPALIHPGQASSNAIVRELNSEEPDGPRPVKADGFPGSRGIENAIAQLVRIRAKWEVAGESIPHGLDVALARLNEKLTGTNETETPPVEGVGQALATFSNHNQGDKPLALIFAEDVTGDGEEDLVIQGAHFGAAAIFVGGGDGTFEFGALLGPEIDSPSLAMGDFNGDEVPDFAVLNPANDTVSILLSQPDGTYQAGAVIQVSATEPAAGPTPTSSAQADFNGDGDIDVATVHGNSVTISSDEEKVGEVLHGWRTHLVASPICAVDLNGDEELDLVLVNGGTLYVFLGQGDGTFEASAELEVSS